MKKLTPYLFIAPFYIVFLIFMLGPVLYALFASVTNWQGVAAPHFTGLNNYIYMLHDVPLRKALLNTLWYSVVCVVTVIPLSFILANLLNITWLKGRNIFRLVYFLPIAMSALAVGVVFKVLYDADYGVINFVLKSIGLSAVNWAGDTFWFKPAVAGMIMWRWTGSHMIYFLAGLQGIPKHYYEAAEIDGANGWQRFIYITLPSLRPVILFVTVILTISALQIFEEPYMLYHDAKGFGGPNDAGLSLAMYLYRQGFVFLKRGYGSAVGTVMLVIVATLSLIQTKMFGLFRENV